MLSMLALLFVAGAAGPVVEFPFNEDWSSGTQGSWAMRVDHRNLLAMRHDSTPSEGDASATYTRMVTVPENWAGPVSLHFYCSDDVATRDVAFANRRRKQVLVDGEVVWSADVCDGIGSTNAVMVPLSASPGEQLALTLVGFSPGESSRGGTEFTSTIYWGDVAIVEGEAIPPTHHMPSHTLVSTVHERRWPVPVIGTGFEAKSVDLVLDRSSKFPEQGFPMTFGIPLPPGKVDAAQAVRLRASGKTLAAQRSELGRWPDESVKWVLCDFIVTPGVETVRMEFAGGSAKVSGDTRAESTESGADVKGTVSYGALAGALVENIHNEKHNVSTISLRLRTGDQTIPGTADEILVWYEGPVRTTVLLRGQFARNDALPLPFHLYASTYSGLPYLKLWLRLFNETAEEVAVSGLELQLHLPDAPESLATSAGPLAPGAGVLHSSAQSLLLSGSPVPVDGPVWVSWPGGAAVVKDFRERYPRAVRLYNDVLVLDCIAAASTPMYLTRGEASSHEVWLALGEIDAEAFAESVEHPPILRNAEYFCRTGAFGPAAPLGAAETLAELRSMITPAPSWEAMGQHLGNRHFPDSPFIGGLPNWSNNYYERMLGLWSAWLVTGDRTWFEHAMDTCRHIMDVAVVHSDIAGNDWRGAMHGPGPNHVSGPWSPLLRVQGLSFFQMLTGEPEAREAVDGVVDYCVRSRAGMEGPTPRHAAAPFDSIVTAYSDTGDIDLLDLGTQRVAAILERVDMRRGLWKSDREDGNAGNVPWHVAQLGRPLYLWYRATGDVAAAEALVALTDAIVCENVPWDTPGAMHSEGPVAKNMPEARHDLLIVPMLFAAHELTGDAFFKDAAQAQWARWREQKPAVSPLYEFWHVPWLAWHLEH